MICGSGTAEPVVPPAASVLEVALNSPRRSEKQMAPGEDALPALAARMPSTTVCQFAWYFLAADAVERGAESSLQPLPLAGYSVSVRFAPRRPL